METYRISWAPGDVDLQRVLIINNGSVASQDFGPSVDEYDFDAAANATLVVLVMSRKGGIWGHEPAIVGSSGGGSPEAGNLSISVVT